MVTVSILGVGARGGEAYGRYMNAHPDMFKIVCLCDKKEDRLSKYGKVFNVPSEKRFLNEDDFFAKRRSDMIIISTLDKDHVRHAKKAIALGYNIMLEKPISDIEEELIELRDLAKEKGILIFVCHVLRYTPMMLKIKEILDSGVIGKLVHIDHSEHVGYWHMAHSYVRGNWHSREQTTFMLMAKCCHDLDLLQYFADSKCDSISSFGALNYFNLQNKPEGSADRCLDCQFVDECCYSAKRVYVDRWVETGKPANAWPFNTITEAETQNAENLTEAIKTGPYGKCVFSCDNDVVDNQVVNVQFKNGITASLKMIAFVKDGGRYVRFYGSKGEIILQEDKRTIEIKIFGGENTEINLLDITKNMSGHSGGDSGMINALYEVMTGSRPDMDTTIEKSVESHLMAIAAEKSRLNGGKTIKM